METRRLTQGNVVHTINTRPNLLMTNTSHSAAWSAALSFNMLLTLFLPLQFCGQVRTNTLYAVFENKHSDKQFAQYEILCIWGRHLRCKMVTFTSFG